MEVVVPSSLRPAPPAAVAEANGTLVSPGDVALQFCKQLSQWSLAAGSGLPVPIHPGGFWGTSCSKWGTDFSLGFLLSYAFSSLWKFR